MKRNEVLHFYKSGGFNHLVNVSVDDNLFAAVTFTDEEMKNVLHKYPLAKDNLFALVDGVEIKLKDHADKQVARQSELNKTLKAIEGSRERPSTDQIKKWLDDASQQNLDRLRKILS